VPLVVPEVNPEALVNHKGIIANPNCSTIIMVTALKPLYDKARIKRIIVSTYQAVSGAGKEAIDELTDQVKAVMNGEEAQANILPSASMPKHYQIAFNLIPQIDVFMDNGYSKEEMKMVLETQKIFNDPNIAITATTIRVPVYRSHSEAITIETETKLTAAEARRLLEEAPGVIVLDNPDEQIYPMPLFTSNKDEVFVGRIREDISHPSSLNLWVVGDQIRKGAALNALQIAEYMIKQNLI
jgi:aspartate-semialdehyde dehydrogenase